MQGPQVTILDGSLFASEAVDTSDEHPPGDIQLGEQFASDVVHTMFQSPQWKKSALFITYDEHGGLYDHVPPPRACAPDKHAPELETDDDRAADATFPTPNQFDRLGVRVPFIVVSPYAKKGHTTHDVYDHTSITRFIEAKFDLPALTRRDANALPPYDAFDFANPPFMTPPAIPDAAVDGARLKQCESFWEPAGTINP